MKHLLRITSCNGVVYEERMTEGQLSQFLRLTQQTTSLGVAFQEWKVTLMQQAGHPPQEVEPEDSAFTPLLVRLPVRLASREANRKEGKDV